eukprot:CFRG0692T1
MNVQRPTQRLLIIFEYIGSSFSGVARTKDVKPPGVQNYIEDALEKLYQARIKTYVSSRTDTGVHGLMNSMHCDTPIRNNGEFLNPDKVRDALNHYIPKIDVRVRACFDVHHTFNSRFMATGRSYTYRLLHGHSRRSGFEIGRSMLVEKPLNVEAMHEAAQVLVGTHDFTSFRASGCQASQPVRSVYSLAVKRANVEFDSIRDGEVAHVSIHAKGFLYRQVRNIVGILINVGLGRFTKEDVEKALLARDRSAYKFVTAKADGLYLTHVHYPFGSTLQEMLDKREELKTWSFHDVPPWERDGEFSSNASSGEE